MTTTTSTTTTTTSTEPPAPRPRAVLLGASNLIHGLPSAVSAARRALGGGPIEALVAAGHGRSYGSWSRAALRGLPGILDSGLWPALERGAPAGAGRPPVLALLTDVGNDIGYGRPAETVAGWVEECVRRLAAAGATTVVTRLPMATLRRLPPWRFKVVANLLFPGRRHDLADVLRRAEELDRRLVELAERDGLRLAALEPAWYRAYDAIHLRLRWLPAAWASALEVDGGRAEPGRDRLRILLGRPELFTLAGLPLRCAQPAVRLADGSSVSLY